MKPFPVVGAFDVLAQLERAGLGQPPRRRRTDGKVYATDRRRRARADWLHRQYEQKARRREDDIATLHLAFERFFAEQFAQ